MRTAVVRIDVDPAGQLTQQQLRAGMATLRDLVVPAGADLVETDVAAMPAGRRHVRLLIAGTDADIIDVGMRLCAKAFGTEPVPGVVTYVSRGTDDDALGVLAGLGLTGEIGRTPGADGLDVVHVTLADADVARVGESRIHTALEASLNCEVHIHTR
ncbi:hypothetical protein [Mycolicibacter algericus]|uniref:Uncharacterized protein n=2 Tax=Mycolicibacter algericus TaxID=1288388 RepID=A0A7I9YDJ9_MYCAL|nr:hypothetical protein [Mycolicibacter algericus]OQZ97331.1 hypothetical protein BST10_09775 [Mycolicibacter algericus DSM 45454]GFG86592.1 hypothetical protein MALGJ_32680 [Mycolicibacter algericus]